MADLEHSKCSVFWVRLPASVLCVDTINQLPISLTLFALSVGVHRNFHLILRAVNAQVVTETFTTLEMISNRLREETWLSGEKSSCYIRDTAWPTILVGA
jgi:hypothetical protein